MSSTLAFRSDQQSGIPQSRSTQWVLSVRERRPRPQESPISTSSTSSTTATFTSSTTTTAPTSTFSPTLVDPTRARINAVLMAVDYYFMTQIEHQPAQHMGDLQDMWTQLIEDVEDIVNTVGIEKAEMLVEDLVGDGHGTTQNAHG